MLKKPISKTKRILVLIDLSTVAYQIASIATKFDKSKLVAEELIRLYETNGGLYPRTCQERISVIWCKDSKLDGKYWRHDILADFGIKYKPGRVSDPTVEEIKILIFDIVPSERIAGCLNFEADDIIANLQSQFFYLNIDIITCDTDLLQLVDDRTRWLNTLSFPNSTKQYPQVRDKRQAIKYLKLRFDKLTLEKIGINAIYDPRQIVDIKLALGDQSDGLPGGNTVDQGIVDLRNPIIQCPYRFEGPLSFFKPNPQTDLCFCTDHTPILCCKGQNKCKCK